MNTNLRRLLPLVILFALVLTGRSTTGIDESLEFVSPPTGNKFIRWHGVPGWTYFVQVSDPADHLKTWTFAPIIEGGNNESISYEIDEPPEGLPDKGFFRLKYTDQVPGPNEDLDTADFDGDGLTNWDEINIHHTDPLNPDTDGDGMPDGWEVSHGLNPNNSADAANIFPGSNVSNLQAFNAGVQANPNATMNNFDGDDLDNDDDADPNDTAINWRKSADPKFVVVELPVTNPSSLLLDDISENGTVLFTRSSEGIRIERVLVDRNLVAHPLPIVSQFLGEFGGDGPTLINDWMLGFRILQSGSQQCTWNPLDNSYNEFQWNGYHDDICDVRANFRVDRTGSGLNTPQGLLANSTWSRARIEQSGNIVSDNGAYWRFNPDTNSYGSRSSLTESSIRSSATLTQTEPDPQGNGEITRTWHLIPGSTGLHVSKANAPFVKSQLAFGTARLPIGVTKQGWVATASEIWSNGTWHLLKDVLGGTPPQQATLLGILDTGLGVAKIENEPGQPKIVLLIPVDLDVNGDGDLDDSCDGLATYMPGYKGDQAMLHTGDSFTDVQYAGPQEMKLIIAGLGTDAVDSATFKILNPTSYFGYCGNAIAKGSTSEDEAINSGADFSFAAAEDDFEIEGTIESNRIWAPIYCKDYGAWCEVEITLKKNGVVIGEPIKLTLPNDSNGDKLADVWQRGEVRRWNHQFRLNEGDAAWVNPDDPSTWSPIFGSNGAEDAELAYSDGEDGPMPAMADKGDGLSALDEYRGYFLDGGPGITTPKHHRLSVARKDALFQFIVMPEITDGNTAGNFANPAAQDFDPAQRFQNVSTFFKTPYPDGGADLDCFMVKLPLLPNQSTRVIYIDDTSRWAYVDYRKLRPITGQSRPDSAQTYIYSDERLWAEDQAQYKLTYALSRTDARDAALTRTRYEAGSMAGFGTLDLFTLCAFFSRFGVYPDLPAWNDGVVERDPSSSTNHIAGGMASSPAIDITPARRGCQFAVNAISEQYATAPSSQEFNGLIEWATAHEMGHALIWARDAGHPELQPGLISNWAQDRPVSLAPVKMQDNGIRLIDLRNRLSVMR